MRTQQQLDHHHIHLYVFYLRQYPPLLSATAVPERHLLALTIERNLSSLVLGLNPLVSIWLHCHYISLHSIG